MSKVFILVKEYWYEEFNTYHIVAVSKDRGKLEDIREKEGEPFGQEAYIIKEGNSLDE